MIITSTTVRLEFWKLLLNAIPRNVESGITTNWSIIHIGGEKDMEVEGDEGEDSGGT